MIRPVLVLMILFFAIYMATLDVPPLFAPDETRYAEIPREMLKTGNWITPKLNGMDYFEKPVLGYWATAISLFVFGENAWAVRFPSMAATGLAALMLYFFVGRLSDKRHAVVTAFMYLSFLAVVVLGKISLLDILLNAFITGGLIFFFLGHEPHERKRFLFLGTAGLFAGLAFYTKNRSCGQVLPIRSQHREPV